MEERVSLLLQNVGRGLRGEEGKLLTIFLLNADGAFLRAVASSPAVVQGSERAPIFAGTHLPQVVDQARRWHEAGGGDWPSPDPGLAPPPTGRKRRTRDELLEEADAAIKVGTPWPEFRRKHRPERVLSGEEVGRLKARFKGGADLGQVSGDKKWDETPIIRGVSSHFGQVSGDTQSPQSSHLNKGDGGDQRGR